MSIAYLQAEYHREPKAAVAEGLKALDKALEISPAKASAYLLRSRMNQQYGEYLAEPAAIRYLPPSVR